MSFISRSVTDRKSLLNMSFTYFGLIYCIIKLQNCSSLDGREIATTRPLHYRGRNIFSEIFTLFHFPQKSKMAAKIDENTNFTPLHRTLLHYPVGQKFARTRSISYGFRDIHTFSFSTKIQDGRQKWRKSKFSPFSPDTLVLPCGSKIRSKLLYLLRFARYL